MTPANILSRENAVLASFERSASSYQHHANVQRELATWLAEWLPQDRSGDVLEIGAGPGTFTRKLIPWEGRVVATDASPAMCAVGRRALPELPWLSMNASAPLPGPWQWIMSSGALQWLEEPSTAFAAMRSCLRPGGKILIGLFSAGSLCEWQELAGDLTPLRWRDEEDWRKMIARSGLEIVRDAAVLHSHRHVSARALLRSLHGVGAAPVRCCPPVRLRRLLADYDRRFADTMGGVRVTWSFYRCEATRAV